jgi:acetoin utilization deacetylase AcuC-like enzyme
MESPTATRVYYSPAYTAAAYPFDTTRKAQWIAESLRERPLPGVSVVEPQPIADVALKAVHDAAYVDAVRTGVPRHLAESNGFPWDPGIWHAVRTSSGGSVAASVHALRSGANAGSLSSGLHHARRACGAGFCTFNGLALSAKAALDAGARRVLIIDLDAHVGDGTLELIQDWSSVSHIDITVAPWEFHPGDPDRCTLDVITDVAEYLPTLSRRLRRVDLDALDLCIYNAGMDVHADCEVGGLPGMTLDVIRQREHTVFDWAARAGVPVAFVLAGGYVGARLTRDRLVALHRLTIEAALRQRS